MTTTGESRPLPRKFYFTYPICGVVGVGAMWATHSTMREASALWWLALVVVAAGVIDNAWWMFAVLTAPKREGPWQKSGMAAPAGLALVALVVAKSTVGSATALWFAGLAFLAMALALPLFLIYVVTSNRGSASLERPISPPVGRDD